MNQTKDQFNIQHDGNDPHDAYEVQQENIKEKGKGFFIVNLSLIFKMVSMGAAFEEVVAFLVLVRGSGKLRLVSSHGANSIALRTGLTYTRAEKALKWLIDHNFIVKADESDEKYQIRKPRYCFIEQPNIQVVDVAFPNDLMDGIGRGKNNPPMARIFEQVSMGSHCNISYARLDALILLLTMYQHHDLAGFGGINPRGGLFREYLATENSNGNLIEDIEGTNAALFEIEGSRSICYVEFSRTALFYVPNQNERNERFVCAFLNLHRLGFFYEVIQVWNVNPNSDENAYPLYSLYIKDRHARKTEPYLSTEIHKAVLRRKTLNSYDEFFELEEFTSANIVNTGRFRFLAHKSTGGFPIGIYRLRFRPHTRDCGKGIAAEISRFNQWSAILEKF